MLYFFCLALSFIAPLSPLQKEVTIYGRKHFFPRALYDQVVPASVQDAGYVAKLSVHMPLIYEMETLARTLPFRPRPIYERLISGEGLFTEAKGARLLELVVVPELRKRGVARVIKGRLMKELSDRNIAEVNVLTRVPLSEPLSQPYEVVNLVRSGFHVSLIIDHMLSRFSLN